MLLTLQERFAVLSILPAEANFATLRIMHDLRTVLAPTETELAEFEIENMEGGGVRWISDLDDLGRAWCALKGDTFACIGLVG